MLNFEVNEIRYKNIDIIKNIAAINDSKRDRVKSSIKFRNIFNKVDLGKEYLSNPNYLNVTFSNFSNVIDFIQLQLDATKKDKFPYAKLEVDLTPNTMRSNCSVASSAKRWKFKQQIVSPSINTTQSQKSESTKFMSSRFKKINLNEGMLIKESPANALATPNQLRKQLTFLRYDANNKIIDSQTVSKQRKSSLVDSRKQLPNTITMSTILTNSTSNTTNGKIIFKKVDLKPILLRQDNEELDMVNPIERKIDEKSRKKIDRGMTMLPNLNKSLAFSMTSRNGQNRAGSFVKKKSSIFRLDDDLLKD